MSSPGRGTESREQVPEVERPGWGRRQARNRQATGAGWGWVRPGREAGQERREEEWSVRVEKREGRPGNRGAGRGWVGGGPAGEVQAGWIS
jgi:hypothetical protein